jgi:transcriptional regulator with XRE-family HTH domain
LTILKIFLYIEKLSDIFVMSKDRTRKRLGRQLAAARRSRHWRLDDIARRTGRQPARISEMETGKANSTIDMIADAGDTLGLSLLFVPSHRLEEILRIVGDAAPAQVPVHDLPSVFQKAFVDDSVEDDEQERADRHAGPR